jgi:hypothetical protein
MTRAIALCLILSGCVSDGYVVRSVSVGARPGAVNFTVTFDNVHLPETQGCIEFCAVE